MSKTVIIGTSGSGKTCCFYGMLHKMQCGISGFSLRINDSEACRKKLRGGMLRLGDTSLPTEDRWPDPSHELEKYNLDLLHNMGKLDSLEWIDYPGEHVSEAHDDFINLLDGANCLFVCVDGSLLQGDEDALDDIADDFYNASGMDLCSALMCAEQKSGEAFPPVCILITKYDAVSPELQNTDLITKFVKKCFPALFHQGNGKDRMVTICPVSLGKDIADGGKLRPKNVEKPLFFALLLILVALQREAEHTLELIIKSQTYQRPVGRLLHMRFAAIWPPKPDYTEELKRILADIQVLKQKLLMENQVMPLFINGKEESWSVF